MEPNRELVHFSHCDYGEYEGLCKYGEADCPVLVRAFAPVPVPRRHLETFVRWFAGQSGMQKLSRPDELDTALSAATEILQNSS